MTVKRFRVFNFPDVDKFGVSDDVAEVTVAFCDKKWEADYLSDLLNELNNENEQLKQRNDRQAKRLAELYELMAKKDWESLTEIIDDFCSCEEQLQRESGTYGD